MSRNIDKELNGNLVMRVNTGEKAWEQWNSRKEQIKRTCVEKPKG